MGFLLMLLVGLGGTLLALVLGVVGFLLISALLSGADLRGRAALIVYLVLVGLDGLLTLVGIVAAWTFALGIWHPGG